MVEVKQSKAMNARKSNEKTSHKHFLPRRIVSNRKGHPSTAWFLNSFFSIGRVYLSLKVTHNAMNRYASTAEGTWYWKFHLYIGPLLTLAMNLCAATQHQFIWIIKPIKKWRCSFYWHRHFSTFQYNVYCSIDALNSPRLQHQIIIKINKIPFQRIEWNIIEYFWNMNLGTFGMSECSNK